MKLSWIILAVGLFVLPVLEAIEDESERSLSRQKKSLFFPQFSVLQLSMCLVAQISSLPSHKVAINSGFQINYGLPFKLSQFYSPMFWARSLTNMSNPMMDFFERMALSQMKQTSDEENDDDTEVSTIALEEDEEETTAEHEDTTLEVTTEVSTTTTEKAKKKRKPKMKREATTTNPDLTAGQFYSTLNEVLSYSGYHEDCLLKSVCELAQHPLQEDEEGDHLTHEIVHMILTPSVHQAFDPETESEEKELFEEAEALGKSGADCGKLFANCETSPLHRISRFIHETNEI